MPNRQRRDRPLRPKAERIGIRIDKVDLFILTAAAAGSGESLSSFIRRLALSGAMALQSRTPAIADLELKSDSATIERKATLRVASFKSKADRTFTAEFWVADGQPDLEGDAGSPAAFKQGELVVISAWAHSAAIGDAVPVGKGTIDRDGSSMIVRGVFFDTAAGRDAHTTIKELRDSVELSMAYRTLKSREPTNEERQRDITRVLLEVEVLEISFVLRGASGPGRSGIREIKKADAPATVDLAAIVAEVRAREARLNPPPSPEEIAVRLKAGILRCQEKHIIPLIEVAVPDRERARSGAIIRWASAKLGIVVPALKFFSSEIRSYTGCFDAKCDVVWLRQDLDEVARLKTSIHETVHACRKARGIPQSESAVEVDTEQLLTIFARQALYGNAQ